MPENSSIIVIGHKNPDTDSIVSALVYAELKNKLGESAMAGRVGEMDKEAEFVLSYFSKESPELVENVSSKKVILVDHSDSPQSAEGLSKAEVLEIIDHHYIGDITTTKPIFYRAEPLGSTSSVIFKIAEEKNIDLTEEQAGLLLAGIISDTSFFHSPTTTLEDKEIGEKLAKIAKINAQELAEKMFDVKSDIKGQTAKQIIASDYKEYEFGGVKFGVGVLETVKPKKAEPLREEIFKALQDIKKEQGLDLIFFSVVDILKQSSSLYLVGEKEKDAAEKIFAGRIEEKIMILPGITSRKKQIIPPLADFLEKSK